MIYKVPHTSIINLVLGTPQKRKKKTGGELSSCSTSGTRRDKYLVCWYRLVQI